MAGNAYLVSPLTTNHGRGGPDIHAAFTWWANRPDVGRTVILRASDTYVIASYVTTGARRTGLMTGNRLL